MTVTRILHSKHRHLAKGKNKYFEKEKNKIICFTEKDLLIWPTNCSLVMMSSAFEWKYNIMCLACKSGPSVKRPTIWVSLLNYEGSSSFFSRMSYSTFFKSFYGKESERFFSLSLLLIFGLLYDSPSLSKILLLLESLSSSGNLVRSSPDSEALPSRELLLLLLLILLLWR